MYMRSASAACQLWVPNVQATVDSTVKIQRQPTFESALRCVLSRLLVGRKFTCTLKYIDKLFQGTYFTASRKRDTENYVTYFSWRATTSCRRICNPEGPCKAVSDSEYTPTIHRANRRYCTALCTEQRSRNVSW